MNALLLHPLADPKGLLSLSVDGIPSNTLYLYRHA
jgi:hypothetical protein